MDGIAEPSQLLPTMTSMATTIGTLLEGIMGTSNVESNEDSTAEELCSHLVPIDTASADKPGVVEYDTDIGDDVDMKVSVMTLFVELHINSRMNILKGFFNNLSNDLRQGLKSWKLWSILFFI